MNLQSNLKKLKYLPTKFIIKKYFIYLVVLPLLERNELIDEDLKEVGVCEGVGVEGPGVMDRWRPNPDEPGRGSINSDIILVWKKIYLVFVRSK